MESIGVRELKAHATDILRRVREEGRSYEVTYHGRTIARLVPVDAPRDRPTHQSFWDDWDALALEIGARWPAELSAEEAIRAERRD